jgi:hypothetical protein
MENKNTLNTITTNINHLKHSKITKKNKSDLIQKIKIKLDLSFPSFLEKKPPP